MVGLRDYARPVLSTQHTCCDAFRVVRKRWAQWERLELYELRRACATLPIERGLAPVANQLGHTDGGALVQRLYGHSPARGMRDRIGLALGSWGAEEEQTHRDRDVPANGRVS